MTDWPFLFLDLIYAAVCKGMTQSCSALASCEGCVQAGRSAWLRTILLLLCAPSWALFYVKMPFSSTKPSVKPLTGCFPGSGGSLVFHQGFCFFQPLAVALLLCTEHKAQTGDAQKLSFPGSRCIPPCSHLRVQ